VTTADVASSLPGPTLVVGGYGYRNVGDEAILAGLLAAIGIERHPTVVSRAPAETTAMHGVRAIPVWQAIPALLRHRSVVIGGGGIFGRDMGALGGLIPYFGLLASALGRPVALLGVDVERGGSQLRSGALRRLVRRAISVTVRDAESAELVREFGAAATVVADLSAEVPGGARSEGEALLREAGMDPSRPIIGLCLTAVNPRLRDPLADVVAGLLERMPGVQFCFVPMSQHPLVATHNDLVLARSLRARAPRLAILEGSHQPSEMLAVFECLAGAICMRYHSLLFAERVGIPVLPIPYASKCDRWLAARGLAPLAPTADGLSQAVATALGERLAWTA
jgi:polysaccharide pyruvyl transferase WcaK-like protein